MDISFPPLSQVEAKVHPISKTFDEVISIFGSMGYSVAEGPDIETDFYNFTALNIPEDHPAREMQDTFYIEDKDEKWFTYGFTNSYKSCPNSYND